MAKSMGRERTLDWTKTAAQEAASFKVDVASNKPPEQQRVDFFSALLERIYEALNAGADKKDAKVHFARAMSENVRERRLFRREIYDLRYERRNVNEAKEALETAWSYAKDKKTTPTDIIGDPSQIKHSAIAAELVARVAVIPEVLRNDPEVWYREVAKAYASIDWKNLKPSEEAELKSVIENTFAHIRTLAKNQDRGDIPETNDQFWRGVNDYYFSTSLSPEEAVPSSGNADEVVSRNEKRVNLRRRLREAQSDLAQPNSESDERTILRQASEDFLYGGKEESTTPVKERSPRERKQGRFLEEDARSVREKLRDEIDAYDTRVGGSSSRPSPDDLPAAVKYEDLQKEIAAQTGGKGILDDEITIEKLDELFTKSEHAALKVRLLEVRKWLSLGEEGIGEHGGKSLVSAQKVLRDMRGDRRENLSLQQTEFIDRSLNRVDSYIEFARRSEQPINRLYLTQDELLGLDKDPIGTIDRVLSTAIEQIIQDPESPRAKSAVERLSLMQEYLFSDQYDEKKLRIFEQTGKLRELVGAEKLKARERFRQMSVKQKENLGRSFTIRWHAANFFEQWSNADSPNNSTFQRFLNERMNEDDFFGLDGLYGSLVARAREKLHDHYEALLFDEHENRRGYNPALWEESVKATIDEMKQNKEFQKIYTSHHLGGELFKERPFDPNELNTLKPAETITDGESRYIEACSVITKLANIRMIMSGEKYNLDIRFKPPQWAVSAGGSPSTFLEKQKIAKLMRPWEFHMMTWGSMGGHPAFEKAQLRHRAGVLRRACPEIDEWAKDWTNEVWGRIERYKSGLMDNEERKALFADVSSIFFFTPDERKAPPSPKNAEKMGAWINKLGRKKLEKEIQVYAGLQIDQHHTMRPYVVMFESGYRRDSETRFLEEFEESITGTFGKEGAKGVSVASKVVGKADKYFMSVYTGEDKKAQGELVEALADASTWRPHSMALVIKEGGSKTIDLWADRNVGGRKNFMEAYVELSRNYNEIRARLLTEMHSQIDYYSGMFDGVQREVVEQVFGKYGDQAQERMKEYFKRMQSLSKMLKDAPGGSGKPHGAIGEMLSIRYAPLLTKARWDDYPYEWLQYPERAVGKLSPGGEKAIPLRVSDKFKGASAGEEQSGPWRRMWRDFGGAQMVFEQLAPMFMPDPKVRLKAIETAYQTENGYQGPIHAAINYLMASGGRLAAEKARFLYNPFFEGLPGNSDFYDYYSSDWKGRSVDELRLELEEDMKAGSLKIVNTPGARGIHEAVESYVGITNWRRILLGGRHSSRVKFLENKHLDMELIDEYIEKLNERLPSGLLGLKGVITVPWVGGIFALFVISQIKEQGKEEEKH